MRETCQAPFTGLRYLDAAKMDSGLRRNDAFEVLLSPTAVSGRQLLLTYRPGLILE